MNMCIHIWIAFCSNHNNKSENEKNGATLAKHKIQIKSSVKLLCKVNNYEARINLFAKCCETKRIERK